MSCGRRESYPARSGGILDSKLNQKRVDMDARASTAERVRAVFLEALSSSEASIEKGDVARFLSNAGPLKIRWTRRNVMSYRQLQP